ncbi:hypothetical protein CIHG_07601 [Coccidioides immitis H538.4]|uniref:Uncharacterized protein n=3 Tax=Coccidioides immitis TaxID=5501 RepID=A0A0J8R519_COCIT|nr:hypothetical protein CIRG_07892 [Coccidioides immitis RMSCC 2394]KMU79510.1 hypothetical protein CISG_01928 [Coccidioides immitis RMSCC 3703]KMU89918.1 hypothetical protein CIHG_07601 [Coccidioides immitis H538.4]
MGKMWSIKETMSSFGSDWARWLSKMDSHGYALRKRTCSGTKLADAYRCAFAAKGSAGTIASHSFYGEPGKSASACAFSAVGCSILSSLCARPITHLIGRPGSGNLVSSTRNGGSSVARNGNKPQSQERGEPTVKELLWCNLWLNPPANNETTCGWGAGIGPGITTALGQGPEQASEFATMQPL